MTTPAPSPHGAEVKARRAAMATLAHADAHELADRLALLPTLPDSEDLRPAEIGLVMLRGRIGGDGAPFNLGEATVTRAAVRLLSGEIGHSPTCSAGRPRRRASPPSATPCGSTPAIAPVSKTTCWRRSAPASTDERSRRRAQTAATKVEFFTMLRGED